MPLQATAGAATYDAFGGGVTVANYIEDVFSTYLYTGSSSSLTITNGIDLSTKGGMIWLKNRVAAAYNNNYVMDTARGNSRIITNLTNAANTGSLSSFNTDGFTLLGGGQEGNESGVNTVSWTFRKQPKFFDVVTYTGNGGTLSVSHALASKPGCVIIKRTDSTSDWLVCTRKNTGNIYAMYLNTTAGQFYDGTEGSLWDSSSVSINWINSNVASGFNTNGASYVMYLFAHNAGGFGASGTDNVISCGSFTTDGSGNATVTLGYEPQWVLLKSATSAASWVVLDTMRGWVNGSGASFKSMTLQPNSSAAEAAGTIGADNLGSPTATGFTVQGVNASDTMIYIAIRRGPMRTPTTGTSVFSPIARAGTGANTTTSTGFPVDAAFTGNRTDATIKFATVDRLRNNLWVATCQSDQEIAATAAIYQSNVFDVQSGIKLGSTSPVTNVNGNDFIDFNFRRAPGFFDVVCYTGTGSATTVSHNLGVVPELLIVRRRDGADNWSVLQTGVPTQATLNLTNSGGSPNATYFGNGTSYVAPTASVFSIGTNSAVNASAGTYVAYLFATVAGVSKVFSYTGNGSSQTINCGFTAGARFVLIKRTDSTGDWYVWDSARGIVASNDPHLSLNTTAAEVTTDDSVDTDNTGFVVNQVAATDVNVSSATYIGLAVA